MKMENATCQCLFAVGLVIALIGLTQGQKAMVPQTQPGSPWAWFGDDSFYGEDTNDVEAKRRDSILKSELFPNQYHEKKASGIASPMWFMQNGGKRMMPMMWSAGKRMMPMMWSAGAGKRSHQRLTARDTNHNQEQIDQEAGRR